MTLPADYESWRSALCPSRAPRTEKIRYSERELSPSPVKRLHVLDSTAPTLATVQKFHVDWKDCPDAVRRLSDVTCPKCGVIFRRDAFKPYLSCPGCLSRFSLDRTRDELAHFLTSLHHKFPWDWYATFTFARDTITPAGAQYCFRRYLDSAARVGGSVPYAFRADEYGPLYGRYHLHALVGNVSHLPIFCGVLLDRGEWGKSCCWVHRWLCGYARIYPYDPERGAIYYLSKYVTKQFATWELIGFEPENLIFKSSPEKVEL